MITWKWENTANTAETCLLHWENLLDAVTDEIENFRLF